MPDKTEAGNFPPDVGSAAVEVPGAENSSDSIPVRNLYGGIFLISAAILLLEISLTRIFSYTLWHHFTYVTISLAMLGFGISGAVLASSERLANLGVKLLQRSSFVGAISIPMTLIVVSKVPFHPSSVFESPVQLLYLVVYYFAVTLPFFCAGLAISCAFRSLPEKANKIYFWDLVGAGVGCFSVVGLIKVLGVPGAALLSTTLFLLASAVFFSQGTRMARSLMVAAALAFIPVSFNVEKALDFTASKEKWISLTEGKKIVFSKWSPIFRVDAYKVLGGEALYESGVYGVPSEDLPPDLEYINIAHDGDGLALMLKSDTDLSTFKAFEKSILKTPYVLKENPDVLIIGAGGGVDVGMALQSEARSVLAIELDPITVDLVGNKFSDFVGRMYDRPEVDVVADEGRSFLRRSEKKFDIIQMTGVDTMAALNSGAYVLAENYLYTSEAYMDFMDHLTPDGTLSVAVFDIHYKEGLPRYVVREISQIAAALKTRGIEDIYKHVAIICADTSGYPYVITLTKISPFTTTEIRKLEEFVEGLPFEFWHLPGKRFDNPCSKFILSSEEQREEYNEKSPFVLKAATDDSPFFFNVFKWMTLLKNPFSFRKPLHWATGQRVLLFILILSAAFSVVFVIFPLLKFQKDGLKTRWKWNYITYFSALGLGFMFIEISYIQKFILFLGYPTYSLTVILFSLLVFSGLGSYLSGRLEISPRALLVASAFLLIAVALGYMVLLPPIFNIFLGAAIQIRIALSLLLLLPLGLLLGVFFPTGVKIISLDNRRFIPWAWGINGCASVIGTILSIIIAMGYGFNTVTVVAAIVYAVGILAMVLTLGENSAQKERS